ncbi:hypothetical protein QZH41_017125, partial [Actinostola sp. cb2023]
MEEANNQGIKIRALLLCNPNNPFGYIYSEKLLQDCLEFAHRYSLHVIIDEIYLLSIFKKEHTMKSMLSFTNLPDKQYVHVIWGFSKDFGISGFRCGVLHTWNKEVLNALRWVAYFQSVPTSTQVCGKLLIHWIDNVYIPTNHQRLTECYGIVCDGLKKAAIPYMESYSGLFIWADFRELVPSKTFKEEQKVFEQFLDYKVYIGPGQTFCYNEAGWFRLVFATHPDQLRKGRSGRRPDRRGFTAGNVLAHHLEGGDSEKLSEAHKRHDQALEQYQRDIGEWEKQQTARRDWEEAQEIARQRALADIQNADPRSRSTYKPAHIGVVPGGLPTGALSYQV